MVLARGDVIHERDLPEDLSCQQTLVCENGSKTLDLLERDHVSAILDDCGWNKYRAAKIMGISRSTLYSKLKKHGLLEAH
jgi:transcriptional regulator of acetoin/glycerol metabolism